MENNREEASGSNRTTRSLKCCLRIDELRIWSSPQVPPMSFPPRSRFPNRMMDRTMDPDRIASFSREDRQRALGRWPAPESRSIESRAVGIRPVGETKILKGLDPEKFGSRAFKGQFGKNGAWILARSLSRNRFYAPAGVRAMKHEDEDRPVGLVPGSCTWREDE